MSTVWSSSTTWGWDQGRNTKEVHIFHLTFPQTSQDSTHVSLRCHSSRLNMPNFLSQCSDERFWIPCQPGLFSFSLFPADYPGGIMARTLLDGNDKELTQAGLRKKNSVGSKFKWLDPRVKPCHLVSTPHLWLCSWVFRQVLSLMGPL